MEFDSTGFSWSNCCSFDLRVRSSTSCSRPRGLIFSLLSPTWRKRKCKFVKYSNLALTLKKCTQQNPEGKKFSAKLFCQRYHDRREARKVWVLVNWNPRRRMNAYVVQTRQCFSFFTTNPIKILLSRPTVYWSAVLPSVRLRFLFFFDSLLLFFFVTWPITSISLSSEPGPWKTFFAWG